MRPLAVCDEHGSGDEEGRVFGVAAVPGGWRGHGAALRPVPARYLTFEKPSGIAPTQIRGVEGLTVYLARYAQEAGWREDRRREPNGAQVRRVVGLALGAPPSVDFCGYWQRGRA